MFESPEMRVPMCCFILFFVSLIAVFSPRESFASSLRNCVRVNNSNDRIVCVCNSTYCDTYDYTWPNIRGQSYIVTSSEDGLRFSTSALNGTNSYFELENGHITTIHVDLDIKHQSILGWGGAFTDATGINVKSLSKDVGDKLMQSYFSGNGLQYNFGRVPIAGCDFSIRPYSYDDTEKKSDFNLTDWSLQEEDLKFKIPLIKQAMELATKANTTLKLFGSPWSPPRWMKDNNNFTRGHLIDDDRVYQSYAAYLVKFYNTYKEYGINFWGGTLQNEPWSAILTNYYFNSLELGNEQAIKFVGDYLGPALEASGYTKENFKFMVGDDPLGLVNHQVPAIMLHEKVKKYVAGFAFHWYSSGSSAPYDDILRAIEPIKDDIEFVLMTEACNGFLRNDTHVDFGSWNKGQMYAVDIIEDLLRFSAGWIDWNLALDRQGGPNWVNNFVDSPIIVDKDKNEFYKQPMYYTLGHFSRHFRPGSRRVETTMSQVKGTLTGNDLMAVAVHDDVSGHLIVNVLNRSENSKVVRILINGSEYKVPTFKADRKSINTVLLKL